MNFGAGESDRPRACLVCDISNIVETQLEGWNGSSVLGVNRGSGELHMDGCR